MTSVFNRKSDYIKSLSGEEINSLQKILKKHVSVCPVLILIKMNWGL